MGQDLPNEVAVRFAKSVTAVISVEVGATLRKAIDAGQVILKDINKSGLSFNWQNKKHNDYCDTEGKGNIANFVKYR